MSHRVVRGWSLVAALLGALVVCGAEQSSASVISASGSRRAAGPPTAGITPEIIAQAAAVPATGRGGAADPVGGSSSPDAAEAEAEAAARVVIEGFEAQLIEAMKARATQSFQQRYQQLEPTIRKSYDLPYIAQLVLSRSWGGLEEGQRETFLQTFGRLVVSTFAAEVGTYRGHAFKFDAAKPLRRGRMLVRSQLLPPDGEVDRFDYTLRDGPNGWRIVNVSVNGVSDLALKRAEYGGVMDGEGFAALLERMRAQIRGYEEKR